MRKKTLPPQSEADNANAVSSSAIETVTVTAQNRSTRTENRNSYTTSAMRTTTGLALSPKETPQSVSVITKKQLDEQGISRMEDALRKTTGINVVADGGRYRYQSCGFYIDQIEEDGISSTVPGASTNMYQDAQSMSDLALYDHIEVVRGATGLTQANGAPGGTINATRKRPTAKTQIQAEASVDRFGTVRTMGDVSGSLNEAHTLRGRAIALLEKDNSFKDDVDGKKGLIYGILEADAGDNTKITFGLSHQKKHETLDPSGLLLSKTGQDLHLPRDTFLAAGWNKGKFDKTNVFGEVEHQFNDNWKLTGKLAYTHNKSHQELGTLASRQSTDSDYQARIGILSKYFGSSNLYDFSTNLTGKFHALGRSHDVFVTYSYSKEKGDMRNIDAKKDSTLVYDLRTFHPSDIAYPDWNNKSWDGVSDTLFVTHMLSAGVRFNPLEQLHILAGSSYAKFKSHYVENTTRANGSLYNEDTLTEQKHFTPYLGITFDVTPNQSLYSSYTSIFKPSYGKKDKQGNQIKPKTGNNLEIGWKGAWYANRLNASVALFQIDEKNRPLNISKAQAQAEDPSATRGYSIPFGKVRSHGWEAEISGKLTDNWQLFAGYTFNTSKYKKTESASLPEGLNFSTHTPKHIFRLYTSYKLPVNSGKWQIAGGLESQSKTQSSRGIKQGGYTLWNANLQYRPSENATVSLIGSNLTNKRYYQNQVSRNVLAGNYLGEPRNITLKFNYKF